MPTLTNPYKIPKYNLNCHYCGGPSPCGPCGRQWRAGYQQGYMVALSGHPLTPWQPCAKLTAGSARNYWMGYHAGYKDEAAGALASSLRNAYCTGYSEAVAGRPVNPTRGYGRRHWRSYFLGYRGGTMHRLHSNGCTCCCCCAGAMETACPYHNHIL